MQHGMLAEGTLTKFVFIRETTSIESRTGTESYPVGTIRVRHPVGLVPNRQIYVSALAKSDA